MRLLQALAAVAAATVAQTAVFGATLWVTGAFRLGGVMSTAPVWAFPAVVVIAIIIPVVVLVLPPFAVLAQRAQLSILSAGIVGAAQGVVLSAILIAVMIAVHRPYNLKAASQVVMRLELMDVVGALAAWAAWRALESRRVSPANAAEMF